MSRIHWKPFVVVDSFGYPSWGTRIVLPVLIGVTIGLTLALIVLAVEL